MPRKPRIDAEGYLYHVIVRGLERRQIFCNDADRDFFLARMGKILTETETPIHAFALMPNHFHLLLRRAGTPISTVMRRLLTCYAIHFNRCYDRAGHLFQNRYHSIVCQEDQYYLELLRYIHLNPVRAGRLASLEELAGDPYTGHGYILGRRRRKWFDSGLVLAHFNVMKEQAKQRYTEFIETGLKIAEIDLDGGGRKRIKGLDPGRHERGKQQRGPAGHFDERVLGDEEFVERLRVDSSERTIAATNSENTTASRFCVESIIASVCAEYGLSRAELTGGSKRREVVAAREVAAFRMSAEAGLQWSCIARELSVSRSTVTKIMRRKLICGQRAGRKLICGRGSAAAAALNSTMETNVPKLFEKNARSW